MLGPDQCPLCQQVMGQNHLCHRFGCDVPGYVELMTSNRPPMPQREDFPSRQAYRLARRKGR